MQVTYSQSQCSPRHSSWFMGDPTFRGKWGRGREKRGGRRKERGWKGRRVKGRKVETPPSINSCVYSCIPSTILGSSTNMAMYTAGARYAVLGQFSFISVKSCCIVVIYWFSVSGWQSLCIVKVLHKCMKHTYIMCSASDHTTPNYILQLLQSTRVICLYICTLKSN